MSHLLQAGFEKNDVENQHTRDPIFSWTVTFWQMCKQDLETAAIFSWTALLSKTRLWSFWLGCSLEGGRGVREWEWESGGGELERGMVEWEQGDK